MDRLAIALVQLILMVAFPTTGIQAIVASWSVNEQDKCQFVSWLQHLPVCVAVYSAWLTLQNFACFLQTLASIQRSDVLLE